MRITTVIPFEGSDRLSPRRRPGLPHRRRPTYRLLTVIPVGAGAIIVVVATGMDLAALGAVAIVVSLFVTTWFAQILVSASGGRTRYRALREAMGNDGIALRSTAWIESGLPSAASEQDDQRKPGRRHQMLAFTPVGLELRERPIGGSNGATVLPYAAIDDVRVGTAAFSDWSDRAVLLAGRIEGRPVEFGIVPVDESSLLIWPATDAAYRALLERLIDCATSGGLGSTATEPRSG
ncbi:hypothetical protein J2X63_000878 [Agromyces sp. 3263]|uniref:hypothetical protein n=1 Tax=Agromyces sp. 3263 TaxID=2817750 RepID=UPI00285A59E0|nr:hypothetical protein [Agromyces sp. 3263]MDR6905192.1 hypothetical protein [Agromyces sp. 3263]